VTAPCPATGQLRHQTITGRARRVENFAAISRDFRRPGRGAPARQQRGPGRGPKSAISLAMSRSCQLTDAEFVLVYTYPSQ
jgi:hypothetical protein